jgi:hypothetical protein
MVQHYTCTVSFYPENGNVGRDVAKSFHSFRCRSEQPDFASLECTMLGGVTERAPAKVAPLVVGNSTGFPMSRKAPVIQRSTGKPLASTSPQLSRAMKEEVGEDADAKHVGNRDSLTHELDENDKLIRAMSEEELREAMEVITSNYSAKNLSFLQKMPKINIDEVDKPRERLKSTQHAEFPRQQTQTLEEPTASSTTPPTVESGPEFDIFGDHVKTVGGTALPALLPGQNQAMLTERFDLNGRRIVDFAAVTEALKADLESSGYVPTAQIDAICAICVGAARSLTVDNTTAGESRTEAFVVTLEQAREAGRTQPQDELLHHQYDGNAPGYNFTEMSEVRDVVRVVAAARSLPLTRCLHRSWQPTVNLSSSSIRATNEFHMHHRCSARSSRASAWWRCGCCAVCCSDAIRWLR